VFYSVFTLTFVFTNTHGSRYLIYTETRGHTMAVERLTDDFLASAAGPPPPPPTPPPAPPPAGYHFIGDGACRDASGKEPEFATNEPGHKAGFTEAECAADCSANAACQAISYCATNPACQGACHLYTTSESGAPAGWTWDKSGGGKLPVTKATTESWWRCLTKNTTESKVTTASVVSEGSAAEADVATKARCSPAMQYFPPLCLFNVLLELCRQGSVTSFLFCCQRLACNDRGGTHHPIHVHCLAYNDYSRTHHPVHVHCLAYNDYGRTHQHAPPTLSMSTASPMLTFLHCPLTLSHWPPPCRPWPRLHPRTSRVE